MKTRKEFDFISREVYKSKGLKHQLAPTGYEAFRVSPRKTIKFGKYYKRIYGASVEPDYSRPIGKKDKYGYPTRFGAKVTWYPHGYTSQSVKGGTRLLQPIRSYPVNQQEARMKLMLKRRSR